MRWVRAFVSVPVCAWVGCSGLNPLTRQEVEVEVEMDPPIDAVASTGGDQPSREAEKIEDPSEPPVEQADGVFDFRPGDRVSKLDPAVLSDDPTKVLFLQDPSFEDDEVLGWLKVNLEVYDYLPTEVQRRPAIRSAAVVMGVPEGVEFVQTITARVDPSVDARVALYASDTTNGYISEPRREQRFEKGIRSEKYAVREEGEQTWVQVTQGRESSREEDREAFDMGSNVGEIAFEDFTLSEDPGWVPEMSTRPALLAKTCDSEMLTFESVENGDLAVYVEFSERSFDGFTGSAYEMLQAKEAGTLEPGAKVRTIWCDDQLLWVPFG